MPWGHQKIKLTSTLTVVRTLGKGEIRHWSGSIGYQVWWDGSFIRFGNYEECNATLEAYLNFHDPEAYDHLKSESKWTHYEDN